MFYKIAEFDDHGYQMEVMCYLSEIEKIYSHGIKYRYAWSGEPHEAMQFTLEEANNILKRMTVNGYPTDYVYIIEA